ncbi:MAG: hypothetical protein GY938_16910 [Ketobacter sp.]|nr:hypothetical protein [Ketobacter sp.]
MKKLRVLIACEFSGVVRDAFAAKGHDAWSCDVLPTEQPGQHIRGDVLEILDGGWDMMIAHPPCTYLANSGVQHLHKERGRWDKMITAKRFFYSILQAPIKHICIENPVPHSYANLPSYTQIIEPYEHGHEVTKKTCLWLKNLPLLSPTNIVDRGARYIGKDGKSNGAAWYQLAPSADRWKIRSRTFEGIAQAMSNQWTGSLPYQRELLSVYEVSE